MAADFELERLLSSLRGLLVETMPRDASSGDGAGVSGQASNDRDDEDKTLFDAVEISEPSGFEAASSSTSDSEESGTGREEEEEEEDEDEDEDEEGADPLWLAAARGDAVGVAALLKHREASSIGPASSKGIGPASAPAGGTAPSAASSPTVRRSAARSSPLAAASARGHAHVVQLLLGAAAARGGASAAVDAANARGSTPLLLAAARGRLEVRLLRGLS
jgi:ankyrin repeat protein